MKTTNAIEKKLKAKCKRELEDIVNKFLDDIEKLQKHYGGNTFARIEPLPTKSLICLENHHLKSILTNTLEDKFGDHMLSYKSSELLRKLELFNEE